MKKRIITILLCITAFFLGVSSTLLFYEKINDFTNTKTVVEESIVITEKGIADAVEKVYDSVVVIQTLVYNRISGSGSGFIYKTEKNNAYIITNHHVVDGGTSFKVTYSDSEEVEAELVGSDIYSDIAILKVPLKEGYKEVEIGSSENMRVGDTTFIIGAPLGDVYSWSVTRGILSGKERLVEVSLGNNNYSDYIMNVLQTDSPINSGNSGGPIANANGEVIGVVNAKIASTNVEGIGFAIPIEVAIEKSEQLINGNKTTYPYLGISMLNVEDALNYRNYRNFVLKNKVEAGVIVVDIEKDSLAYKYGLESGDIIISVNNQKTDDVAHLRYELYRAKDSIKVKYIRDAKEEEIEIKLK